MSSSAVFLLLFLLKLTWCQFRCQASWLDDVSCKSSEKSTSIWKKQKDRFLAAWCFLNFLISVQKNIYFRQISPTEKKGTQWIKALNVTQRKTSCLIHQYKWSMNKREQTYMRHDKKESTRQERRLWYPAGCDNEVEHIRRGGVRANAALLCSRREVSWKFHAEARRRINILALYVNRGWLQDETGQISSEPAAPRRDAACLVLGMAFGALEGGERRRKNVDQRRSEDDGGPWEGAGSSVRGSKG